MRTSDKEDGKWIASLLQLMTRTPATPWFGSPEIKNECSHGGRADERDDEDTHNEALETNTHSCKMSNNVCKRFVTNHDLHYVPRSP
jgi:hypothetical protein